MVSQKTLFQDLIWLFYQVVNGIVSGIIASALRCSYKGMDLLGTFLIALTVKVPKTKDPIPPIGERPLLKESVSTIAQKIRQKEVSCEEVVRTFIARIVEINGQINSVVDERFEIAIEEAKKYDVLIESGQMCEQELETKYPLLGIPFTIKDSFSVKGLKHTAGSYLRKDISAAEDADVVKILKEAGAIPIGVTNVSELCMWWESVNTVYGRSKNPYDTRHIVGGSSGGEAGLQGAAGSAFGVGSDIGGSIRMPAFFCGVYGHKPTIGLVSNVGQEPKTTGVIADFLTTGPIARHPRDLPLLFNVMVGGNRDKLKPVTELKSLRILYMEDDGGSPCATPVSSELKLVMNQTIQFLEKTHGVKAQKVNISKLYHSLEIWANGMSGAGAPPFCEELALGKRKINPYWELVKFPFGLTPHTFPALVLGIIEKIVYIGNNMPIHKEMIEMGHSLTKEIQDLLSDDGILLYPTHPTTAPRHYKPMSRPADFSYSAIFNVLGVPVVQVPLGLSKAGLPLGIQIVGGMYNDLLLMKFAQEVEEGFGGWVPPCQDSSDVGHL